MICQRESSVNSTGASQLLVSQTHHVVKILCFNVAAYILGLVATFISLFLMNAAQPALLYLVPFTLIPTILVAWCRGDLRPMWDGDTKVRT